MTVTFALNRIGRWQNSSRCPQKTGVHAVEVRHDIEGQECANGMPAAELKARLGDTGLRLASVNALQRSTIGRTRGPISRGADRLRRSDWRAGRCLVSRAPAR